MVITCGSYSLTSASAISTSYSQLQQSALTGRSREAAPDATTVQDIYILNQNGHVLHCKLLNNSCAASLRHCGCRTLASVLEPQLTVQRLCSDSAVTAQFKGRGITTEALREGAPQMRTVFWCQFPENPQQPESWNVVDVHDAADKPEVRRQVLDDGSFDDSPELRLLLKGGAWRKWENFQTLPSGVLKVQVIPVYQNPVADISKKRRLSSSYADRRKKLPSASEMNLTIMRQEQGVMRDNDIMPHFSASPPLYLNHRCNVYQVPIKLLHPIFGKFEHLAATVQPSTASLQFVQTVCAQANHYYASEKQDYQQVMRRLWRDLLRHVGGVSRPAVGEKSVPDLALSAPHGLVLVAELEVGLDERAQPAALRYYEQLWEETWPDILNQSCAASFIVEMMGAGLRIGAAAWGETIYYEALTPIMNLLPLWGQELEMVRLAQQVTALLYCLADLYAEYLIPASMAQSDRAGLFGDGIPIALHDMHRFQNVCHDRAERGLYSYTDPKSGQKRLAKFTGRYGTAVHAAWAAAGLAPTLFDVTELCPHSFLVAMELLPGSWRVLSDLSLPQLLASKPFVLQALHQAQSVGITMGTTGAHGNMRLPKVAVHQEGQQWRVKFLDFDWAGVAGEHMYPPFMNFEIEWPSGVHAYAVMLSEHDSTLLQMEFDLALS